MAAHIDDLTQAVDSIETRFYAEGRFKDRPITLQVDGSSSTFPMSLTDASQKLQTLQAKARPSPFGRANLTVVDPSVRVAKELAANEFTVDFDPADAGVLEQIRQALVPEASAVRAELYKLNLMTQGGFFKPHKDTPRGGDTCFGTLVVALPVPFTGGALRLKHGNQEASLNWAGKVQAPHFYSYMSASAENLARKNNFVPSSAGLQWAAFFGDVEHEVLQVQDGYRITLTYTLHRDSAPDPTADVLLLRAGNFYRQLVAALADPEFLPEGGALGFYCHHLYEETAIAQTEAKLSAGGANAYAAKLKLKNEDAVIAAVLSAVGLEVKCLRLMQMEYLEEDYVLGKMPTKRDATHFGSKEYIEDSFRAMAVTPEAVGAYSEGVVEEVVGYEVSWVGSKQAARREWVERFYGEYFGNEASMAMFYTAAAFAAVIPPIGERATINRANRAKQLTAQQVHPDLPSTAAGPSSRTAAAGGNAGARSSGRKRKGRGAADADFVTMDSDDDGDDDLSDSGDQDDSGSEDDQGDYKPPASKKGNLGNKTQKKKQQQQQQPGPAFAGATSATAVPLLFRPKSPTKMTAAEKRAAALSTTRQIHVTGGQGGRAGNGSCTVTLPPGAGLKELKAALRKKFGKVSHSKMGSLMLVDENGHATNSAAKATDLVDGARVHCTYTYAEGNVRNLMGGCMGFRRRGFGGFGGFWF